MVKRQGSQQTSQTFNRQRTTTMRGALVRARDAIDDAITQCSVILALGAGGEQQSARPGVVRHKKRTAARKGPAAVTSTKRAAQPAAKAA